MKNFESILLLKLPFCTHPEVISEDENFRTKSSFRPIPSLALASLCAFIDKYKTFDYNLKAIDLNIKAYTKPGVPIDISSYLDLLTKVIKNNKYDVLGISAMYVFNVRWVETVVKLSRKFHPKAKIIIGGGYPTLFPERCLKQHDIDKAVIGEGEATFLHLLNKYNHYCDPEFEKRFPFEGYASKNKKGKVIVFKKKQSFIDLADLPIPAWHYLNINKYFKRSGDKALPIQGSRGCPYNCSYCSTYLSWGRRIRYKPVKNLIKEIVEIKKKYNVVALHFVDDNLSFSKEWIKEFLEQIIKMKLSLKLKASNFSVKHMDKEIISLLKKAGMDGFGIAVESGSPEIQKRINKNLNFDLVRKVIKTMKDYGLHVHLCWMIGFPNETIDQINKTFNFARELRAHSNQFLTVLPYPGTQLFDEAKSANLLISDEDDLDKFDNRKCDYLKSDEWNYNQLQQMIYDANIEMNFLNNPLLDTAKERNYFLNKLEKLLLKLPEHIIAHLIAGNLCKQKKSYYQYRKHYDIAMKLFKQKTLHKTFAKYLSWDNLIIKDFNQFLKKRRKK